MTNWVKSIQETSDQAARLPVARRDRFGLYLKRAGRGRTAIFSGAPAHYYASANREWLSIDTQLHLQPDGRYAAAGLPVVLGLDGSVEVNGEGRHRNPYGYRQRSWRVGVLRRGSFVELARFGDGKVNRDRIVREAGIFRHELTLLASGVREELLLSEAPPLDGGEALAVETLLPGGSALVGIGSAEFTERGLRFPQGWASDAAGRRVPLLRWSEHVQGTPRLYSAVPAEWLEQATYPVVIDPDVSLTAAADATIEGSSAATSTTLDNVSGTLSVGAMTFGGLPHLWRAYLKFNTSGLGLAAVVEQANLRMYASNLLATNAWTSYVRQYNWSAHDPLTTGNRETAWDGLLATANSAVMATHLNPYGAFVTSADLPTAYISISGNTYYGLWCNQEATSFANGQGAFHQYASADNGTAGNRPVLMIEYLAGYPRGGPVALQLAGPPPRARLADTRRILRARVRRTALRTAARERGGI